MAAGMQQLYDTVRGTGANNLVIIGGMHWGFLLDKVKDYRVKGHNIAYATHPYDYSDKQPDRWAAAFEPLMATDPVIFTEFGIHSCDRMPYLNAVLDYADKHRISWVAWAWWTPSETTPNRPQAICAFPALITDWTGTPSSIGQLIRTRLLSYRNEKF
jgi:endoglucanase